MATKKQDHKEPAARGAVTQENPNKEHKDLPDLVRFDNVYKSFGAFHVFNGLNLVVKKGSIHYIIGRSGSGKSVLIKHILGFLKPDKGKMLFDSKNVEKFSSKDWLNLRIKVGMLFQDSALFDSMNIFENVAFPLREHSKFPEDEIQDIVNHKLKIVGLGQHTKKMPSELSGGMRKRAALARAIALNPELVLLDEPSSGLDPIVTSVVDDLILNIQETINSTFIVISHDMSSTLRVAQVVSMLYNGKIVFEGSPAELKNTDEPLVKQFINGSLEGPFDIFY